MKVPFSKHRNWVGETQLVSVLEAVAEHLDNTAGRLLMHVDGEFEKFQEQVQGMARTVVQLDFRALVVKITYNPEYLSVLKQYADANGGGGVPYTWDTAFALDNSILMGSVKKCTVVTHPKYSIIESITPEAFAQVVSPHSVATTGVELMYRVDRRSRAMYVSFLVPYKHEDKLIIAITPSHRDKNCMKFYDDMVAFCITQSQNVYDYLNSSNDISQ